MIGFSSSNANASYETINYALYLAVNQFQIYENGGQQNVFQSLNIGDVLRVERVGTSVKYYQNGLYIHTSTTPSSSALLVDASLYTQGATLDNIKISFGSVPNTITRTFDYDHAGRLLKTWHQVGATGTKTLLSKNEYNELGQLVTKNLHNIDPPATTDASRVYKQTVDYRYNIRGWLTKVNDATTPTAGDLFSMDLNYNTPTANGGVAQYNGNISETVWRGPDTKLNSYGYSYDPMNRLTEAKYYNTTDPTRNSRFDEKIWDVANNQSGYDLNGNIKFLTRSGKTGITAVGITTYGGMDNLSYAYIGNQLQKVDDSAVKTEGFKEGIATGNDYNYDANGNMLIDLNKDITGNILYNHLNLPEKVTKTSGEYVKYTYDASGRKLKQEVFNTTNVVTKATDYVGDYIYENDILQFISHEEGRVVKDATTGNYNVYQYHLKDHLGNVRLTFTTKDEVEAPTATLETANVTTESGQFLRYANARRIQSSLFDHTNGSAPSVVTGYAERLSGGTNEKYGLAKSISVMPGDVVDIEVYAKYIDPTAAPTNGTELANLLAYLAGTLAVPPGTIIDGAGYGSSTSSFPSGYGGLLTKTDTGAPKAYLNWLVFDWDYNFLPAKSGFRQISTDGKEDGTDKAHERVFSPTINITEAGYVYVYLSNESATPVEVYFDDFKITQTKSPVIQSEDFYPFGLRFNSYNRENSVANHYEFNGKEEQDELDLGWLDFGARMYDPSVGRFISIDPATHLLQFLSPYSFALNNPINLIEIDGLLPGKPDPHFRSYRSNGFIRLSRITTSARYWVNVETQVATSVTGLAGQIVGWVASFWNYFGANGRIDPVDHGLNAAGVVLERTYAGNALNVVQIYKTSEDNIKPTRTETLESMVFDIAKRNLGGKLIGGDKRILVFYNKVFKSTSQADEVLNSIYSVLDKLLSDFDLTDEGDIYAARQFVNPSSNQIVSQILGINNSQPKIKHSLDDEGPSALIILQASRSSSPATQRRRPRYERTNDVPASLD
jgi:RHS repeat-associated protein